LNVVRIDFGGKLLSLCSGVFLCNNCYSMTNVLFEHSILH